MKFFQMVLLASLTFVGLAAQAAAIDVTATVTAIGDALVPIGLIGTAVLAIYVAIKSFRWVRRALA